MATKPDAAQVGQAIAENGRVLATLDDWRAIMFLLLLVTIVLVVMVAWVLRSTRLEREKLSEDHATERQQMRDDMAAKENRMYALADKFGDAAEGIKEQTNRLTTELQIIRAVTSRQEAVRDSEGSRG